MDRPAHPVALAADVRRAALWRRLRSDPRSIVAGSVLALLVLALLVGPYVYRVSPTALDLAVAGQGPSASHWLGTDENGRDVLSRLLHGGRVSLAVGGLAVAFALLLGSLLGALAGFRHGRLDAFLMRLTDAMLSIPTIFVVITALAFFGSTIGALVLTIGGTAWMGLARLVRGELLSIRELAYIDAARTLGQSGVGLFARHMLPQLVPTILVNATLGVGTAILTESALSYLGIGVQPPAASWGNMLSAAQSYFGSLPWLVILPGAMIFVTVAAVNVLGDALRDAADPREVSGVA
ncbi:MAG: ABC transporter permease [Gemmatimonadota bacterium]